MPHIFEEMDVSSSKCSTQSLDDSDTSSKIGDSWSPI